MKNRAPDYIHFEQVPDPDNDDLWLIKVLSTVLRINTVKLNYNEEDDTLGFSYDHTLVSGPALDQEIMNQVVKQLIVDTAEYRQGRAEYEAGKHD